MDAPASATTRARSEATTAGIIGAASAQRA